MSDLDRLERRARLLQRLRYPASIGGGLILSIVLIVWLGVGHGVWLGLDRKSSFQMTLFVWPIVGGVLLTITTVWLVLVEHRLDRLKRELPRAVVRER